MKVKLIQDSIIFISGVTKAQFEQAKRFVPEALTLSTTNPDTKKKIPVFVFGYGADGSVNRNGIVFDSTTDNGYLCVTLTCGQGFDDHMTNEQKVKVITEEFADVILKANELEAQITAALNDNELKINTAMQSVEAISIEDGGAN